MRKIGVRDGETVTTNQPIETSVDPVGATPVVRVLQNHLCPSGADLKRTGVQIHTPGKPDLVHLEIDAALESHALP